LAGRRICTSTVEGGGAANAGIISGDIITGVNGTEITSSTQLQEKITSYKIGTEVKLTVMRSTDGKYAKKEITVTLGKKPEEQ
jgi:serine protease Do